MLEDLHGVVLDDAQITEVELFGQLEQRAHAGFVDLDAKVIDFPVRGGDVGRGATHAETDLHDAGRNPAENGLQVEHFFLVGQQETRPQFREGTCLAAAHATGAQHEGADAA